MRVTGACDYNHTFSDQKRLELLKKGSAPWALQLENRSHGPGIIKQAQPKTGFLENGLHDGVVAQHLCDNPVQLLVVRDLDETPQQLATQAASLVLIRNQNGNFRLVLGHQFIEPSHRD